ncbi:peptide synthetase [Sesbania bispinosa]|nr:peptide synthetase [Sesbania bispinosa]
MLPLFFSLQSCSSQQICSCHRELAQHHHVVPSPNVGRESLILTHNFRRSLTNLFVSPRASPNTTTNVVVSPSTTNSALLRTLLHRQMQLR